MGSRSAGAGAAARERHEDTLAVGGPGHRARRRDGALLTRADTEASLRLTSDAPTMRAVNWLIWTPLIVLGTLLVLFGLALLLGRVAGGRYLRPIVVGLSKVPFLKRLFERMSNAALERENPELASAIRKLQRFGTPTTPEGSAARPCPSDTRRTSRLHAGRRPAGRSTSRAEPRGPSSGDRCAACRKSCARAQKAEALTR